VPSYRVRYKTIAGRRISKWRERIVEAPSPEAAQAKAAALSVLLREGRLYPGARVMIEAIEAES